MCGALLLIMAALCGCTLIDQMMPSKRAARARALQLQALQLSVMRFADEYVGRSGEVLNPFQRGITDPEQRLLVQTWKLEQATSAYTIASGPNPASNALDMVVLASLSSMVMHDAWAQETYGARAAPVQQTYQALEKESWRLLENVLTDSQMTQLREIMTRWRAKHPEVRSVSYVHFRDFAESVSAPLPGEEQQPGSLFSKLGLDPLSGLDPAVRELAQSRQLAERTIYYMQRVPALLDMQVERLTYELALMPETKAVLGDAERASQIGSASAQLVNELPGLLDRQREALMGELLRTLHDESATIGTLAGELRETLQAGTETANALQGTLAAVERLKAQFAGKPASAAADQGPPFDIRQYTEMLRQASSTTRELTTLAQRADSLLPVLRSVTQDAATRLDRTLNHLFLLLLALVLAAIGATLLAMVCYRRIMARFERPRRALPSP